MQRLLLANTDPTPAWLENVDLSSVLFPRYLPNAAGSTPVEQTGHRTSLVNARHCRIHGVADNGWWAGSPTSPTYGTLYNVIVTDPGWRGKIDGPRPNGGHGHGGYCQNYGTMGQKRADTCIFVRGFTDGTAFKLYHEGLEANNKASNVILRNSIFAGDLLVRALSTPVLDVIIENCVVIGNLLIGHNAISQRITVRNCVIFGNFDLLNINEAVIENNIVVVNGPYRPSGMLYGPGNYGLGFGTMTNETVSGLTVYTDAPQSVWNGWSTAMRASRGYPTYGVVVLPLASAPPMMRRYDVPERSTANLFVYNPSGAPTVPLDGYYRVRDVRRWEASYIDDELTMAGEPDLPLYWNEADGVPSVLPNLFPTFGLFQLETVSQEEIDMTLAQQLQAALDTIAALIPQIEALETANAALTTQVATLTTDNAALTAQVATLTAERDSAVAFRAAAEPLVAANKANGDALAALFAPVG